MTLSGRSDGRCRERTQREIVYLNAVKCTKQSRPVNRKQPHPNSIARMIELRTVTSTFFSHQ